MLLVLQLLLDVVKHLRQQLVVHFLADVSLEVVLPLLLEKCLVCFLFSLDLSLDLVIDVVSGQRILFLVLLEYLLELPLVVQQLLHLVLKGVLETHGVPADLQVQLARHVLKVVTCRHLFQKINY